MTEPLNAEEMERPRLGASGPVRVRVPAKINLHLGVGPIRRDGYHELTTVYHAISLFDEVSARRGDQLTLTMEGEGAGVLALDDSNLVIKAAQVAGPGDVRDLERYHVDFHLLDARAQEPQKQALRQDTAARPAAGERGKKSLHTAPFQQTST